MSIIGGGGVSHGLILLGLCAPLTVEGIGKVILASSYAKKMRKPQGSHYFAYTNFSWGDVKVFYDASDYSRQLKIRHVFKDNPEYYKYLRSCLFSVEGGRQDLKECGNCEKCLRTLTGLILEGIDPNECNFEIKNNVLDYIKKLFITGSFQTHADVWKRMQNEVPLSIKEDMVSKKYHSKQFFEWFRSFDFENYKPPNYFGKLKHLYFSIKYSGIDYSKRVVRIYFSRRLSKK